MLSHPPLPSPHETRTAQLLVSVRQLGAEKSTRIELSRLFPLDVPMLAAANDTKRARDGRATDPDDPCSPSCRACPPSPFSVRPLDYNTDTSDAPPFRGDELLSLLPASFRTKSDDLVAARRDVRACVEKELDLRRLTDILGWLWIAGRPMPPCQLHHQLLLSRDVFVTERIDMHLVWTTGRIFLKPLPRFLLEPRFWTCHLSCAHSCHCPAEDGSPGRRAEDAPGSPEGVLEHVPEYD
ncbi:hypothetical protein SODALDRAFT_166386 [Sodiomyces alkalinus F11]|uniref:Uncharacterized protein n=1 Tax=Sodiomyces alkalinus (strain CBS 110278 / VKM F-3762 / F11) TaxID=1314773 RepID=A0A3N2PW67_SODAK|nr:hypothetical protein SODALDRAFT_166386 [Sodiomyces alkalinus F11]ROT38616.1 hypothetical protein SODALDRAFT_166386 [Sodiomyces alkalinus F11]